MSYYVLELFFDSGTDSAIRRLWKEIDTLSGRAAPNRGDVWPHISICSCPTLDTVSFHKELENVASQHGPLTVEFASVAMFPSEEGVIFLAPIVTSALLSLHQELVQALRSCGGVIPSLYVPGMWVPHCTLALNLPTSIVSEAIAIGKKLPAAGRIERMGLVEISPPDSHITTLCVLSDAKV